MLKARSGGIHLDADSIEALENNWSDRDSENGLRKQRPPKDVTGVREPRKDCSEVTPKPALRVDLFNELVENFGKRLKWSDLQAFVFVFQEALTQTIVASRWIDSDVKSLASIHPSSTKASEDAMSPTSLTY
ncbi:hypothetical protein ACRRTK_020777 [Alexandromys fortis]